jgi:hypothetical protein
MKKNVIVMLGLMVIGAACKKTEIDLKKNVKGTNKLKVTVSDLTGKWIPTYLTLMPSGQFEPINTFAALPEIEFTADRKFLSDGKPGADCCGFVGNSYQIIENKIKFSDFKTCPEVVCLAMVCDGWVAESIEKDTLTLKDCFGTSKYVRSK